MTIHKPKSLFQSSSRMRVMNRNWSATKRRLHPQSVAEISRPSVLSGLRGQDSTMWDIVWVLPQGHRSVSKSHFLLQTPQCPCSMQKWFSRDYCCRGRSKPGCQIVRSHTRWELTTQADFQLCLHRLLMSTGCKSNHSSYLDGGLRTSGGLANCHVWLFSPLACQWQPSFVGLAVQCWRALEAKGEV